MVRLTMFFLVALLSTKAFSYECEEIFGKPICYDQHFDTIEEIKAILKEDVDAFDGGEIEDLNGDGQPEILLVGNGCNKNCDMVFFTREKQGYRMIARTGGQYSGPTPLPSSIPMREDLMSRSSGYKHIAILNQSGWAEGVIWHFMYNGQKYISAASVSYHYEELKNVIHNQ